MVADRVACVQGRNTQRNRNEAARTPNLPMLWPVWQSEAALEPNVVILTNLKCHVTSFRVMSLLASKNYWMLSSHYCTTKPHRNLAVV